MIFVRQKVNHNFGSFSFQNIFHKNFPWNFFVKKSLIKKKLDFTFIEMIVQADEFNFVKFKVFSFPTCLTRFLPEKYKKTFLFINSIWFLYLSLWNIECTYQPTPSRKKVVICLLWNNFCMNLDPSVYRLMDGIICACFLNIWNIWYISNLELSFVRSL